MTRKLTILVDMDGIVTNFIQRWLENINSRFGISAGVADIDSWSLTDCKVFSGFKEPDLFSIVLQPGFFRNLWPLDGSINALSVLVKEGHDVKFLTTPCGAQSAYEKIGWVDKHFPFIGGDNVILTKDKHLVRGDCFIDDKASTCDKYQYTWPDSLVMTISYPYNTHLQHHDRILTVGHWSDTDVAWGNALHAMRAHAFKLVTGS